MRRMIIVGLAAALAAGLMLLPASALGRKHHKHASCPRSARVDRNHDGIPDRWECRHHLSLKVKQAKLDPDHDGLNNLGEFEAGDDPHKADSNGNGVKDGAEHAGTVASFDKATGTLVINLAGGGTLTGKVTTDTEIECQSENENEHGTAHASSDGSSGDGEHSSSDSQSSSGDHQSGSSDQSGSSEHSSSNSGDDTEGQESESNGNACDASALVPGAVVHEAEVKATSDGAVFEKVELDTTPSPAPTTPTAN